MRENECAREKLDSEEDDCYRKKCEEDREDETTNECEAETNESGEEDTAWYNTRGYAEAKCSQCDLVSMCWQGRREFATMVYCTSCWQIWHDTGRDEDDVLSC